MRKQICQCRGQCGLDHYHGEYSERNKPKGYRGECRAPRGKSVRWSTLWPGMWLVPEAAIPGTPNDRAYGPPETVELLEYSRIGLMCSQCIAYFWDLECSREIRVEDEGIQLGLGL